MKQCAILIFSFFLFASYGKAQNGNYDCDRYDFSFQHYSACSYVWGPNSIGSIRLPVTAACCNPGGNPEGEDCIAPKPSCGPSLDAAKKTCTECSKAEAASPINLSTGNTYIVESDVRVPGLGGGLQLSRAWNSILPDEQDSYSFMFGNKWRSNFEERLAFIASDSYVKYLRADGSVWSFGVTNATPPYVYALAAPRSIRPRLL